MKTLLNYLDFSENAELPRRKVSSFMKGLTQATDVNTREIMSGDIKLALIVVSCVAAIEIMKKVNTSSPVVVASSSTTVVIVEERNVISAESVVPVQG